MKSMKRIAALIVMVGSLVCAGQAMAEYSECAGASRSLRGGTVVEFTVGNETLFARTVIAPEGCWIQVEVMKGPNTGRKYWLNLMQVSRFGELRP